MCISSEDHGLSDDHTMAAIAGHIFLKVLHDDLYDLHLLLADESLFDTHTMTSLLLDTMYDHGVHWWRTYGAERR